MIRVALSNRRDPFGGSAVLAVVASALLLLGITCSNNEPTDAPEPVFFTFTTADGLYSNDVAALVFSERYSSLMAVDSRSNLSVVTLGGVRVPEDPPETGPLQWQVYPSPYSESVYGLLAISIDGADGVYMNLWGSGLVYFGINSWKSIDLPLSEISALARGENGSMWASGLDGDGYNVLGELTESGWVLELNAGQDFYFARITDILPSEEGGLWLATWGTGLINYNNGSSRLFQTGDGLPSDFINRIRLDPETGGLWLVTPEGFHLLDGDNISAPFDNAYLADRLAFDLAVDSEGRHWFATRSNGVLMNSSGAWTEFTEEHGLGSDYVTTVVTAFDGSQVWVGTRNGVSNYIGE